MKLDVIKLDGGTAAGSVELDDALFGVEPRRRHPAPCRPLAAQQGAGRHAQGQDALRGQLFDQEDRRQKGSGGARHGARSAPIFRGGGVYKGPTPRSHGHELTKKVRRLGLLHALSAKAQAGKIVVLDDLSVESGKTSALARQVRELGWKRALVIDGAEVNQDFAQAARNLGDVDVLPSMGANVYGHPQA